MDKEKMHQAFYCGIKKYKDSMKYSGEQKNKLFRALYGVRKFGFSYVLYNLVRFKIPWIFGTTHGTLFFGKRMILPRTDIGSYSFSMYGVIPHSCERRLTQWLINNLHESDVFYDVGAHLGFYTALSHEIIKSGEVHSFEANKKLCTFLNKNFSDSKDVHISCTAVSSSCEEIEFYDATEVDDSSASSRFNISGSQILPSKIKAVSLDEYIKQGNLAPSVIKFDIEGGEYDAILGSMNVIKSKRPNIILEVWGGEMGRRYSDNAVKKLQELGYTAFAFGPDGNIVPTPISDPVGSVTNINNPRDNFMFETIKDRLI